MKRLILLFGIFVWGLSATGCVVEEAYEQFEPTRPGYFLVQCTTPALETAMDELWPVLAFAQYYATDDPAERRRIHDEYFYRSRIATDDGAMWRIIDCERELVILTEGRSLLDEGIGWSYYYLGRDYDERQLPTLTHRDGAFALDLHEPSKRLEGTFTLTAVPFRNPGLDLSGIRIDWSGSGTLRADDLPIEFSAESPLRYESTVGRFLSGTLRLTVRRDGQTDTATAAYTDDGRVEITFNEFTKLWNI